MAAWVSGVIAETILFVATFSRAINCLHIDPEKPARDQVCVDVWDRLDLGLYGTRAFLLFGMCTVYCLCWYHMTRGDYVPVPQSADDLPTSGIKTLGIHDNNLDSLTENATENTPLLGNASRSYDTHSDPGRDQDSDSGSVNRSAATSIHGRDYDDDEPTPRMLNSLVDSDLPAKEEQAAFYRPKKLPSRSWWEYCRGYAVFFPYMWPSDSRSLKGMVVLCFFFVMAERVINLIVPIQVGHVTERLLEVDQLGWYEAIASGKFPLWQLLGLGLTWSLQGSAGLIATTRSLMWIKVSQHTYRGLMHAAFEHVHSLSLDFHLGKRTGEVLSALNKGGAISNFLETLTFNVVPMLIDLTLAIYFFWSYYGSVFALLIGTNTFWYLYITVSMASSRGNDRREMTNADREEVAIKNDSITCYETVKYFNAEPREFKRYHAAIKKYQDAEVAVSKGTGYMGLIQAVVYNLGRLLAAIFGAWKVRKGLMTVGQYTTLLAYLAQLQTPLNFFGTFYKGVQGAMISGERLLALFDQKPTVIDDPDAKAMTECNGHIRWRNVNFAYNSKRIALKNIDIDCAPGTTTAFVGASGGGKSTIFRLMYRYYNAHAGSIEIDGQDVKGLTIDSVRRHIGVVPQDTSMFNESIMYNLRYANPDASDDEIFEACKSASIHDTIMRFPEGYNSKCGERGQKLSGGERQRIAIARTMLKGPRIIMLDEATSALDTNTEQLIQDKLGNLGEGRTIMIIA